MVLRGKLRVYPDVSEEWIRALRNPGVFFQATQACPRMCQDLRALHLRLCPNGARRREPPVTPIVRPSHSARPSQMRTDGRTDLLFFFRCGKMAFVSPPSATELGISKRVPAKLGAAHTCNFHRNCSEARQSPHTCYGQCESFNNALTI